MIAVIIIVSLNILSLFESIIKHGEEKTGKYNVGTTFMSFLISMMLFYFAGLFDKL